MSALIALYLDTLVRCSFTAFYVAFYCVKCTRPGNILFCICYLHFCTGLSVLKAHIKKPIPIHTRVIQGRTLPMALSDFWPRGILYLFTLIHSWNALHAGHTITTEYSLLTANMNKSIVFITEIN